MALTYTPEGQLGSPCPSFHLPSVDGKTFSLPDFQQAKILVVMFICNHCPYVQAIETRLIDLAQVYIPRGIAFVAICANDPTDFPEDSPSELLKRWKEKAYGFPYLIDSTQTVARAFGAVCTPDLFVYDEMRKLQYRGRLDDSWKNPERVKQRELSIALDDLLHGRTVTKLQNPAMGCSIKWKIDDGAGSF